MTKKAPGNLFLKLEMPRKLWKDFDDALKLHGMTRSKAIVIRQMIADFVDHVKQQHEKRTN